VGQPPQAQQQQQAAAGNGVVRSVADLLPLLLPLLQNKLLAELQKQPERTAKAQHPLLPLTQQQQQQQQQQQRG
jgi:hypothetical protein